MTKCVTFTNQILGEYLELATQTPYRWRSPDGLVHDVKAGSANVRYTDCLSTSWTRWEKHTDERWVEQGSPLDKSYANALYKTRDRVTCLMCLGGVSRAEEFP